MRRFLLYFLLFCGLLTGHSAVVHAKSPFKQKSLCFERLFDHEKIEIRCIDSEDLGIEEPEDVPVFLRVTKVPRKKRYYLNSPSQSSSYTTRFTQLEHNLEFYIPVQQNKTGVYQQQSAFLPAYYSFLSRYTPF